MNSAPDWSSTSKDDIFSSTVKNSVVFQTKTEYVNNELDKFYKSKEFSTLLKQGYDSGNDFTKLQTRTNEIKQQASKSYSTRSVPQGIGTSKGRAILALAELGIGLAPAIYEYFTSNNVEAKKLPISAPVSDSQPLSVPVSPENSKVDLTSFQPLPFSESSSLISSFENSNVISVSMLGQIQNSISDLTNSIDLLTIALSVSLTDIRETLNISAQAQNLTLTQMVTYMSENTSHNEVISESMQAIASQGLKLNGDLVFDTSSLTKAISELKPSEKMLESKQKFYDSQNQISDFKLTPIIVEVAPQTSQNPAEVIKSTPLELEAKKNAQDYAYIQSKHSFEFDDDDFDFSLSSLAVPTFIGNSKGFETASSMPDYNNVDDSLFKSMDDMFKTVFGGNK